MISVLVIIWYTGNLVTIIAVSYTTGEAGSCVEHVIHSMNLLANI